MKILVTGGGGFLGRALARRLLARGDSVRIVTRSPHPELAAEGIECLRGDLTDPHVARDACTERDAVFHTAAKAGVWGTYEAFFAANVDATQNILDACRAANVPFLVHTSTPSVVYNGHPLAGADETLPLTKACPCAYPVTKAEAERRVLDATGATLRTIALRPHLIWGAGDPHLVPRLVRQARAGRLRIIGDAANRVDLTHVDNAVHAHLLALSALQTGAVAAGHAYFISDGEPVVLWEWINALLRQLDIPPVTRRVSLSAARCAGAVAEALWKTLSLHGEPPITRFVAVELAKDHWFDIRAARRDLGYTPVVDTAKALAALVDSLKRDGTDGTF
jgi:nucleoside-diphosphate-sugar epimerase